MRRPLHALAALALFCVAQAGCRHTAGVCDCDVDDPCLHRAPWAHLGVVPADQPEPLKEMPKAKLE